MSWNFILVSQKSSSLVLLFDYGYHYKLEGR